MPRNIIVAEIDEKLKKFCDGPIEIPEKKLSQKEVEAFWGIDRKNLVTCKNRHKALNRAIEFRDKNLREYKIENKT